MLYVDIRETHTRNEVLSLEELVFLGCGICKLLGLNLSNGKARLIDPNRSFYLLSSLRVFLYVLSWL